MSATTNRAQLAAAFAAIYLLWGGTYLAIALGLQSIPPFLLIGSRSILGGMVLFAFSQLRGLALQPWRDWSHAAVSGVLLFVGCHGALAYAQRFVPSGLSAIILATIPFWIVLVNAATGQREPLQRLAGLVPGFVPQQVTVVSLMGVLYLALLGSVVGNTAYLWLLDRMSAPIVATYTFVNPVVAVILGAWVLGERITMPSLAGAALVIGSVVAL